MVLSCSLREKITGMAILACCLLVQGCSHNPVKKSHSETAKEVHANQANELLLKTAKNYTGLIRLYKERLEKADNQKLKDHLRIQLGEAYLESGDPDSAIFYIDPIILEGRDTEALFLLKSKALLAKGDLKGALRTAITAHGYGKGDPEVYNQLGMVYARSGDLTHARHDFQKARDMMMDDAIVQNNLAMLDILEKKYDAASDKLLSLYRTGQADERVRANLALALAKSGRYQEFSSLYGQGMNEDQRLALFKGLSEVQEQEEKQ